MTTGRINQVTTVGKKPLQASQEMRVENTHTWNSTCQNLAKQNRLKSPPSSIQAMQNRDFVKFRHCGRLQGKRSNHKQTIYLKAPRLGTETLELGQCLHSSQRKWFSPVCIVGIVCQLDPYPWERLFVWSQTGTSVFSYFQQNYRSNLLCTLAWVACIQILWMPLADSVFTKGSRRVAKYSRKFIKNKLCGLWSKYTFFTVDLNQNCQVFRHFLLG